MRLLREENQCGFGVTQSARRLLVPPACDCEVDPAQKCGETSSISKSTSPHTAFPQHPSEKNKKKLKKALGFACFSSFWDWIFSIRPACLQGSSYLHEQSVWRYSVHWPAERWAGPIPQTSALCEWRRMSTKESLRVPATRRGKPKTQQRGKKKPGTDPLPTKHIKSEIVDPRRILSIIW